MKREDVEAMLQACKRDRIGPHPDNETLAALCRTQLAVWDAPVVELRPDSETYRGVQVDTQNSARIVVDMGQALNIGQRVRIVPEVES